MNYSALQITTIYSIILFIFASIQHFLLGTQASDIGTFEQFSWLIANGKMNMASSYRGIAPLQDHFSLLLLPIGVIYKFIPSTYTLIALQSVGIGSLPAVVNSIISKQAKTDKLLRALIVAIVLSPYMFLVNLGDFHPEIITVPIMLLAISESKKDRNIYYYLYLLIALLAKKAQVLFGFGLCLYSFFNKRYLRGSITLCISIFWWIISASYSAPGGDYVKLRLGYLGSNKIEILSTLITKPWHVFTEASPESIILYSLGLLLPFIGLINRKSIPALIATLPVYLTNIISSEGIQRELNHHYSIVIIPFLIIGCIDASNSWNSLQKSIKSSIYYLVIFLSLLAFIGYSRIGYFKTRYLPLTQEAIAFQKAKSNIPKDSSILTTKTYAAHFANRELFKIIETNDFMPLNQFNYIVLPRNNNFESIGGRLKTIKGSETEKKIDQIIKTAQNIGMQCSNVNKYIRICKQPDAK